MYKYQLEIGLAKAQPQFDFRLASHELQSAIEYHNAGGATSLSLKETKEHTIFLVLSSLTVISKNHLRFLRRFTVKALQATVFQPLVFNSSLFKLIDCKEIVDPIDELLKIDEEGFYRTQSGEIKFRGVRRWYGDTVRNDKAMEQSTLSPMSLSTVFSYVNEVMEMFRGAQGFERNVACDMILLDDVPCTILDNGIVARNLVWKNPQAAVHDHKYEAIQKRFGMKKPSDLIWLKFTTTGALGTVARGADINFETDTSSGVLIIEVGEQWDGSFVFIFPLTEDILGSRTSGEVELAVGTYLISKGVPIIDYYSHNN